MLEKLINI